MDGYNTRLITRGAAAYHCVTAASGKSASVPDAGQATAHGASRPTSYDLDHVSLPACEQLWHAAARLRKWRYIRMIVVLQRECPCIVYGVCRIGTVLVILVLCKAGRVQSGGSIATWSVLVRLSRTWTRLNHRLRSAPRSSNEVNVSRRNA